VAARLWHVTLGVVVVAAPALATCALLATLFDAALSDYFPLVSDEIAYQRQIAAFVEAGFQGGYFTAFERPAPYALSHFSVHGPAFPVIYGSIGRVIGWGLHSGPLFNLGVLAFATSVFLGMSRLSIRQTAAAGVVILTSWWVLLMASITMQESLNQAVMIVMAGCAARLLHPETRRHGVVLVGALAVLAIASVLRPTNWIVAVPLVLVAMRSPRVLPIALATLAALLGIPAFWLIWRFLSAPIPGLAIEWGPATASGAPGMLATYFLAHVGTNIAAIFDVIRVIEAPLFQHVMFETAAVACASAVLLVSGRRRAVNPRGATTGEGRWSLPFAADLFNVSMLGLALLAFLGFYFDSEASISRVTAPFLLLSLLLLVATRRRLWMVAAVVVTNLLVAPSFLTVYRAWRVDLFTYDRARYELFRGQLATTPLAFDPAQNGWCNTLLTTTYEREIVAVPDGIGLSVGRPASNLTAPIRSRWVLATPDSVKDIERKARLEHLATTALGSLYVNRDADCR
jgi:hypothetical protein